MSVPFLERFPPAEHEKRLQLCALMDDWKKELPPDAVTNYFAADGFYPYYFRQKKKILFIAREMTAIDKGDYIEELLLCGYHKNKIGSQTVDQNNTHKRLMQIAYGILQGGKLPLEDLPKASEIAADFGTDRGISFAFMEISKYANGRDDAGKKCDPKLMTAFLWDSRLKKRNFIQEEIALLEPDIIITMNLWSVINDTLMELALGKYRWEAKSENQLSNEDATLGFLVVNGREVPLIETWHFSRIVKDKEKFYDPVMSIINGINL